MELFVSYGSNYFSGRQKDYGLLPTLKDYEQGDSLVRKLLNLVDDGTAEKQLTTHNETQTNAGNKSSLRIEPQSTSARRPLATPSIQSTVLDLLQTLADVWQSRPLETLPAKPEHVSYVSQYGTSNLHFNRSIRSLDWLEEHGLCMDNIRSGPSSTIPQAGGRGAFAARFIPKGNVVAPMPLIHIPDRNLYRMYDSSMPRDNDDDDEGQLYRNASAPVHWQLMLNYCFGHRHSSLLLCPYGVLTSTINHSQQRANTKIMWSQKASRHYEWLEQPVREWGRTRHAGLAFELIATRDIRPGEEIVLDYGDEWEAAWQEHVATWKPPPPPWGSKSYVTADEFNQRLDVPIHTQTWSFRHDMRIPDEIMPKAWLDRLK